MASTLSLALATVVLSSAACADRPFVRVDPPVSSQGVTVALVGQKCEREGWNEAYDVLDLEVVLRVTNGTPGPIGVTPAEMRLLASGNSPLPRVSSPKREDAPLEVAPNSNADIRVHFDRRGNGRCNQGMQLSLDRAVNQDGRAVTLPPLSFMPSPNDA
jgi:hypothetical protein